MKLLRLAVETEKWELAALAIVLATARVISEGGKPDGSKKGDDKDRAKE